MRKRTGIVLGLLLGAVVIIVLALTGTVAAQTGEGENCVACHTDKATLQELAVEPEEEEELSEGEG
ncbi:MAG: hypothetical protein B6I35_09350 [Anaerolineaceae bacterium 4572_32.2]|nr:MAG: hypothetical protein B6I35_09350 [Anaerolineaceae bacterium 4572_32.2]